MNHKRKLLGGWPTEGPYANKKILCVVKLGKDIGSAVLKPDRVTPDGKCINLGGYYSDEFTGYTILSRLKVISVVKELPEEPQHGSIIPCPKREIDWGEVFLWAIPTLIVLIWVAYLCLK